LGKLVGGKEGFDKNSKTFGFVSKKFHWPRCSYRGESSEIWPGENRNKKKDLQKGGQKVGGGEILAGGSKEQIGRKRKEVEKSWQNKAK